MSRPALPPPRPALPPPRSAVLMPLLVALAFLAVIGAMAGWWLGVRAVDEREARAREEAAGQQGDQSGGGVSPPVTQDPGPAGPPCPAQTEALAAASAGSPGGLVEVFYIRTEGDRQVWICRDRAGSLFYQGYAGPPDGTLVEGVNALFLAAVREIDGGYEAENRSGDRRTVYTVTADSLEQDDGERESTFDVIEQRP